MSEAARQRGSEAAREREREGEEARERGSEGGSERAREIEGAREQRSERGSKGARESEGEGEPARREGGRERDGGRRGRVRARASSPARNPPGGGRACSARTARACGFGHQIVVDGHDAD